MVTDDYWTSHCDQFVKHINVESLHCALDTNIMLYANYTSINFFLLKTSIGLSFPKDASGITFTHSECLNPV